MSFENRVVVVTGGASGIGLGLCQRFARMGARVVLSDRDARAGETRADEIGATAIACDVGSAPGVRGLVEATFAMHGQIDVFVSNAGMGRVSGIDTSLEAWRTVFDVNVLALVHAARYALPSMLERGEGTFVMSRAISVDAGRHLLRWARGEAILHLDASLRRCVVQAEGERLRGVHRTHARAGLRIRKDERGEAINRLYEGGRSRNSCAPTQQEVFGRR